jgi:hypothetical protein
MVQFVQQLLNVQTVEPVASQRDIEQLIAAMKADTGSTPPPTTPPDVLAAEYPEAVCPACGNWMHRQAPTTAAEIETCSCSSCNLSFSDN